MVTHDLREAVSLADQIVVMHEGRIVQSGPSDEGGTTIRSGRYARLF